MPSAYGPIRAVGVALLWDVRARRIASNLSAIGIR